MDIIYMEIYINNYIYGNYNKYYIELIVHKWRKIKKYNMKLNAVTKNVHKNIHK